MKRFEDILGYDQTQMKNYLCNYLCGVGYKIKTGDGYIFAKGDIPVLLIAHMDTFGKEIPKTILKQTTKNGIRIVANNTIVGGDDRCGIWMIMNIIKQVKCHVLFLEDEEIGCVGAKKFAETNHIDYIKENISFMLELDRRGKNDCVYYSNDNQEFMSYIQEKTKTVKAYGSMSDISTLMPVTEIAGVNISCGYYNEHTPNEYVMVDEMNDIMQRLIEFLTSETGFPKFEYVPRKYNPIYDYSYRYAKPKTLSEKAIRTMEKLCLVVVIDPDYCTEGEEELYAFGKTTAECWATLFLENEDLCFSMVTDYYFV